MNFGYELPLEEAAMYFNLHCFLAMFCELKGADFCLICSPSFGIPSLIEDLLENCKAFSDFGHLLLHAMNNCPEDVVLYVLDIIVEKGFDVNYIDENNKSPIMIAIGKIFKRVVKSLIDKGCDINKEYENNISPIMYAKMLNLRDIVDILIDSGAED
ncbi:ankyrin repeat protein, putative [Trichomonas vaginalis G3]|uniref:Ankyrin repeat protein, putative n=1 Tax=Trichomonas vaginalis (strain ATCC PRA-98 / G3) TaxID=412133 RepID=A2FJ27_TRIV3|nr:Ankyrin repeat family [Trichomonas vaginalis G3]EAX95091.1 ankyrin repeat protein, putative [Trichomonas vaginalis G3]KAI5501926.1 Ankyrin repeat family [Trichomonas vaginalis G3]|eukprot:XP_001308021.1 ankyrin repeat protein [Trichomonas vaginalis G3]